MKSLLYSIATILIIGWGIGYFEYASRGLIHILLIIGIIAFFLAFIRGKKIR